MDKELLTKQTFPAVMNNQSINRRFPETKLLHSQLCPSLIKSWVKKYQKSCQQSRLLFYFDEMELYDINIKRSLDLSENKKQRCLKL